MREPQQIARSVSPHPGPLPGGEGEDLPPHSEEGERGVLGCILLGALVDGKAGVEVAAERIGDQELAFYDLRHQVIWAAMRGLHGEGLPVDSILLQQRLRDSGHLDSCGGVGYLSELPDAVPSAEMLPHYLELVWNKFLARQGIVKASRFAADLMATGGLSAGRLADFEAQVAAIRTLGLAKAGLRPERLKRPMEYGEKVYDLFFGQAKGEPGLALPRELFGEFPFKVRGSELTLVAGEKGNGKSTFLQYIALHMAQLGALAVVASMEVRPEVTLAQFVRQLLGVRELPDTEWGRAKLSQAMGWLERRVLVFDFLGIADWRELLWVLSFVGKECAPAPNRAMCPRVFALVDSVMRLGIANDDFTGQDQCAKAFSGWCNEFESHMALVNHFNKGDGSAKSRQKGSGGWLDNANNFWSVHRNERKGLKRDELKQKLEAGKLPLAEYEEGMGELFAESDGHWDLHNQRWAGSRQNGRLHFWYDTEGGLQFFKEPGKGAVRWLERWGGEGVQGSKFKVQG